MAATNLAVVPPPEGAVHRIGHGPNPFQPPPWQIARGSSDLTFGGRFDDPTGRRGISEARRFRTIYCSTSSAAAFGESIASFRAPLATTLEGLAEIDDDEPLDTLMAKVTDPSRRGIVPKSWRQNRLMMSAQLDPEMRFIDLVDAATLQYIRDSFAVLGATQGLVDIDYSALVGPYRILTQEIANHFFEHIGEDGQPSFAGLRYVSRLNLDWECWAIFDHRMRYTSREIIHIGPGNRGLMEASQLLNLAVEADDGRIIRRQR